MKSRLHIQYSASNPNTQSYMAKYISNTWKPGSLSFLVFQTGVRKEFSGVNDSALYRVMSICQADSGLWLTGIYLFWYTSSWVRTERLYYVSFFFDFQVERTQKSKDGGKILKNAKRNWDENETPYRCSSFLQNFINISK